MVLTAILFTDISMMLICFKITGFGKYLHACIYSDIQTHLKILDLFLGLKYKLSCLGNMSCKIQVG